jgi:uncharacterized membrane protein
MTTILAYIVHFTLLTLFVSSAYFGEEFLLSVTAGIYLGIFAISSIFKVKVYDIKNKLHHRAVGAVILTVIFSTMVIYNLSYMAFWLVAVFFISKVFQINLTTNEVKDEN